jgi:arylsulfatase A-like enzyme
MIDSKKFTCWRGLAIVAGLLMLLASHSLSAADPPRLNVVVFFIDDLGWTDLGCQGSKLYETPGVDRIAAEGMRFTHAYSACTVCSPSRAALMTGRYPGRLHVTDWIAGHNRPFAKLKIPDWRKELPLEETTLAEVLRSAGYATAIIGKWHLGSDGYEPTKQGFDVAIAADHRGSPPSYFSPYKIPSLTDGPDGEYLVDRLATEAVRFIDEHREQPFLLYLPHYAVHTPIQSKPELTAYYEKKLGADAGTGNGQQNNAKYAALVHSMSQAVGRVLQKLDESGLANRTLVIFTSDNGGLYNVTGNQPARVGKGSAYEGGVRVPLLVRCPGVTKPGSTSDAAVMTIDLMPTILELLGIRHELPLDGVSLAALLKQTGQLADRPLYWHYPHYHPGGATPYGAMREGDYRLVEFFEDGRAELYNLRDDVGETRDLVTNGSAADQERATRMLEQLHRWRAAVGAQMPTPNPDYDPVRDKQPARNAKPAAK